MQRTMFIRFPRNLYKIVFTIYYGYYATIRASKPAYLYSEHHWFTHRGRQ